MVPESILHLPNNTHKWWFRDPGLRKLAIAILLGFASPINSGYDSSLISGLQANPRFMADLSLSGSSELGLVVSILSLGFIIAAIPGPYLADRYGRRPVMFLGYVLCLAGSLVQTFTRGAKPMLGGRILVGTGMALARIAAIPYVCEIAHPRNRVVVTALSQTVFFIGAIIAAWAAFGTLGLAGNWSWRACTILQAAIPAFSMVLLTIMPESPRWFVARGRVPEAHAMLAKYHANGDMDDPLVRAELSEIVAAIQLEKTQAGVGAFFRTRGNRHRFFIVILCGVLTSWSGAVIVAYYLVPILKSVGITSPRDQTLFNASMQIWNFLVSVAGSLLLERVGRRRMWLGATVAMLLSLVVITACSALYAEQKNRAAGRVVLGFLFVFRGSYAIGYTPLSTAYIVEILPFTLRTSGVALLIFVIGCNSFFNAYVIPIAFAAIGWRYYLVYIATLTVSLGLIWRFFPETQGRTLEEVAVVFDGPGVLGGEVGVEEAEKRQERRGESC